MIFRIPIGARSLHRRKVRLQDAELEGASLFPFFDAGGAVAWLMLVWPGASTIAAMELQSVVVPMWGAVEIDAEVAGILDLDAERATELAASRWHYDPWWLLREPRYRGHPAVPALKASNCAGRFERPIRQLYFKHDLLAVATLTENHQEFFAFKPELLPPREDLRPAPTLSGWRLDPVWLQKDWLKRFHA